MIPPSTIYQIKNQTGEIVFAGNKKDQERYFKSHGGKLSGLYMYIGGMLPHTIAK